MCASTAIGLTAGAVATQVILNATTGQARYVESTIIDDPTPLAVRISVVCVGTCDGLGWVSTSNWSAAAMES